MTQTKLGSWIETIFSTLIGYSVALVSQWVIFPMFDIHLSHLQSAHIALYFTAVSLVRGYLIRRYFNQRLHNAAMRLAADVKGEPLELSWEELQTETWTPRSMGRSWFRRQMVFERIRRQPFFSGPHPWAGSRWSDKELTRFANDAASQIMTHQVNMIKELKT